MSKALDRTLAFLDDALAEFDAAPANVTRATPGAAPDASASVSPPRPLRATYRSGDRVHDGRADRQRLRPW
jgi:hypothetical protein